MRRDVALRQGLISASVTLIALILLAAVIWAFLVERLEERAEQALVKRHQVANANSADLSEEERAVVRRFRLSLPVRDEGAFSWINAQGVPFSNNVAGLDCREGFYDGWVDVSIAPGSIAIPQFNAENQAGESHDRFRFLAEPRNGGCLVFGRSLFEVDALRDSVVGLLLWLVPLCLLPSLLISLYHSWKLRGRLRRIGNVVKTISVGDLDARIPIEGDDDLDRLSLSANRSFDRLQESVGTLQQLTSVMAHDLRAPLSRVAVPLDEAMRANYAGKTAPESLEEVKTGLADVRSVFDALLRITQIESGRRRSAFTSVDLFAVAEGLFEIYQPVVEDAGRTLELEVLGEGSSHIQGDIDLLRQAVVNLIENAMNYTPEGSLVRVGVQRSFKRPALVVSDNGPGLPADERPRVLRRLYRYEASTGGSSGHGLGLSLVKAIVELHDGEIILDDAKPGLLVRLEFSAVQR